MSLSTTGLSLTANAAIDLQLHTTYSDGDWTDEQLLDYLIAERFSLAAITDHDRVDIADKLQKLATDKQFPLLVAVEMSAMWKGKLTDLLCYGFDPDDNHLDALAQDVTQRQHENTRQVFNYLLGKGYALDPQDLEQTLAKPAAQQLPELVSIVTKCIQDEKAIGRTLLNGGFTYVTHDPATIVEAAHQSGAVCILAHPGRSDGFVCYNRALLDELRCEAHIDGIEAYYPIHTPEQTAIYVEYARHHHLLVSAGSDSHSSNKPPIKYRAELCRDLLERIGVQIE
ncbi:MAG: PHP domain-containing protein [Anaerolineales bacterium]|nr:PHP domain-containing protein [Anaerolineales bacterium]